MDCMSRIRRFLREVAERIGLVPFNPVSTLWDSDRRQRERERRRQNY
jgi:hypothetical protein